MGKKILYISLIIFSLQCFSSDWTDYYIVTPPVKKSILKRKPEQEEQKLLVEFRLIDSESQLCYTIGIPRETPPFSEDNPDLWRSDPEPIDQSLQYEYSLAKYSKNHLLLRRNDDVLVLDKKSKTFIKWNIKDPSHFIKGRLALHAHNVPVANSNPSSLRNF